LVEAKRLKLLTRRDYLTGASDSGLSVRWRSHDGTLWSDKNSMERQGDLGATVKLGAKG
jgi:hypothetical protein